MENFTCKIFEVKLSRKFHESFTVLLKYPLINNANYFKNFDDDKPYKT